MHAEVQANPHYTPFLRSVAGVILLASPSQGSALANVATPMVQGASRISGGMSVLFNPAHLQALKPSAQELESVTGEFDAYCAWYSGLHYAALKLAALRETRKTSGFRVVDAASGDIPETTKLVTNWQVQDLEGLNHVEVTKFSSMDDPRLRKILDQFLRMQRA
ncbi:hypothetical protein EJ06DRAFT_279125 [Trichodelitschia bisporula]|uniref:Uncharacterized protein n=1 Tax=Trichodelitschia bisporula TaxID=703511 RepID=A0A6G1I5X5_9PEZI|nr:hypothetical protein EJ06DRAFT_279125 [Trichodelitschia bisporula]